MPLTVEQVPAAAVTAVACTRVAVRLAVQPGARVWVRVGVGAALPPHADVEDAMAMDAARRAAPPAPPQPPAGQAGGDDDSTDDESSTAPDTDGGGAAGGAMADSSDDEGGAAFCGADAASESDDVDMADSGVAAPAGSTAGNMPCLPMKHARAWPLAHHHKRRRLTYAPCGPQARSGELTYPEVLAEQRAAATWRRRGQEEGRRLRQRLSSLLTPTAPSPTGGMLMQRMLGWLPRGLRMFSPFTGGNRVGVDGSLRTAATPSGAVGFTPGTPGSASADEIASCLQLRECAPGHVHQPAGRLRSRPDG